MPEPSLPGAPDPSGAPDVPETLATYLRLRGLKPSARAARRRRRNRADDENAPFTPGRDPHGVGDVLADLTRAAGWDSQLAREDLVLQWADVAGADTAAHTTLVALSDGLLTVQAVSTAWAHELQRMRAHILSEIVRRFPEAGVDSIRFIGPDVPSWKWGPRAIPGRGPRDTYG
jgi:predicted nucleic acid-binding Zn ribbon protein